MTTLIERLEAAKGPDRELANEVLFACEWTQAEGGNNLCDPYLEWTAPDGDSCYDGDQPNPLASMDAALALIPEGWFGRVQPRFYSEYDRYEENCVFWEAYCLKPIWEKASPVNDDYFDRSESGVVMTACAAVCIAALKARESTRHKPREEQENP